MKIRKEGHYEKINLYIIMHITHNKLFSFFYINKKDRYI